MADNDYYCSIWNSSLENPQKSLNNKVVVIVSQTIMTLTIVLGLHSNISLCYIILKTRRLKTHLNSYLVHIAVADLTSCVFLIPLRIAVSLETYWGEYIYIVCRTEMLLRVVADVSKLLFLERLSYERYKAIKDPFNKDNAQRRFRAIASNVMAWSVAVTLGIIAAVFCDNTTLMESCYSGKGSCLWGDVEMYILLPVFMFSISLISVFYFLIMRILFQHGATMSSYFKGKPSNKVTPADVKGKNGEPSVTSSYPVKNNHTERSSVSLNISEASFISSDRMKDSERKSISSVRSGNNLLPIEYVQSVNLAPSCANRSMGYCDETNNENVKRYTNDYEHFSEHFQMTKENVIVKERDSRANGKCDAKDFENCLENNSVRGEDFTDKENNSCINGKEQNINECNCDYGHISSESLFETKPPSLADYQNIQFVDPPCNNDDGRTYNTCREGCRSKPNEEHSPDIPVHRGYLENNGHQCQEQISSNIPADSEILENKGNPCEDKTSLDTSDHSMITLTDSKTPHQAIHEFSKCDEGCLIPMTSSAGSKRKLHIANQTSPYKDNVFTQYETLPRVLDTHISLNNVPEAKYINILQGNGKSVHDKANHDNTINKTMDAKSIPSIEILDMEGRESNLMFPNKDSCDVQHTFKGTEKLTTLRDEFQESTAKHISNHIHSNESDNPNYVCNNQTCQNMTGVRRRWLEAGYVRNDYEHEHKIERYQDIRRGVCDTQKQLDSTTGTTIPSKSHQFLQDNIYTNEEGNLPKVNSSEQEIHLSNYKESEGNLPNVNSSEQEIHLSNYKESEGSLLNQNSLEQEQLEPNDRCFDKCINMFDQHVSATKLEIDHSNCIESDEIPHIIVKQTESPHNGKDTDLVPELEQSGEADNSDSAVCTQLLGELFQNRTLKQFDVLMSKEHSSYEDSLYKNCTPPHLLKARKNISDVCPFTNNSSEKDISEKEGVTEVDSRYSVLSDCMASKTVLCPPEGETMHETLSNTEYYPRTVITDSLVHKMYSSNDPMIHEKSDEAILCDMENKECEFSSVISVQLDAPINRISTTQEPSNGAKLSGVAMSNAVPLRGNLISGDLQNKLPIIEINGVQSDLLDLNVPNDDQPKPTDPITIVREPSGAVCVLDNTNRVNGRRKVESRAARRIILVIGAFFVLWLPLLVAVLAFRLGARPIMMGSHSAMTVTILSALSGMSSAVMPILCGLSNKQIKAVAMTMLRRISCNQKKSKRIA